MNYARLGTWAMGGFLLGVFLHSLYPYGVLPWWPVLIVALVCLGLLVYGLPKVVYQILCLSLFCCLLGLCRFDLDRAWHLLPTGLKPLDPKGFAYVSLMERSTNPYDPRYWLGGLRTELNRRAHILFPDIDQSSLLTGMLYGEKKFTKSQTLIFRRAGLLHIVAVSGSNVTILVSLVIPLLLRLRCSRQHAFVGLTIGLILFVLFVYPSASVVRAAIMGWLVQLAPVVGRLVRPSRLLLLSACLFVLWKSWALLFDVSFALSFLAMSGLMTWGVLLQEVLEEKIKSREFKEIISSTLGATIMTIPYSAWAFGQFTLWGLFTNLLILPVVPWSMLFGAIALFFYRVPFIDLPVRGCIEWIQRISKLVEHLPLGAITLPTGITGLSVQYIIIFFFFILIQRQRRIIHRKMIDKKKK